MYKELKIIDPIKDKINKITTFAELNIETKFSFTTETDIARKGNINIIIPKKINKNTTKLIKEALKDCQNFENKSFVDFPIEINKFSESKRTYLKAYSNIICTNKEIIKIITKETVKNKLEFK